MKPVFADTSYFLGLANPSDQHFEIAISISHVRSFRLITTEWVLVEVGDALSKPPNRQFFLDLVEILRHKRNAEIIPATHETFRHGCDLYARRLDKEWSLTDCISFAVMTERKLTEALTSDHHFEQAGFRALMRQPKNK